MIHINKIHHVGSKEVLMSHKLTPLEHVTLFVILEGKKESGISILDDHILETLSSIEWNDSSYESDFSYVTERYNQFIHTLDPGEKEGVSCLLGLLHGNTLLLATTGITEGILIEGSDITVISTEETEKEGFQYISSGEIPLSGCIFLSNTSLTGLFSESNVLELSTLEEADFHEAVNLLIDESRDTNIAFFRIKRPELKRTGSIKRKQTDIMIDSSRVLLGKLKNHAIIHQFGKSIDTHISHFQKEIQYGVLIVGIIILFLLAYTLVQSLFGVITENTSDGKNDLIKAQNLIIDSQKLTNNKQAFNKNIKEAEEILFRLRNNKVHMADTQDLLSRIEVMKKEVNDIQTIDLKGSKSLLTIDPTLVDPIGFYEYNKKLYLIGKNASILGYTRDQQNPSILSYPTGEKAKDFHFSDDGTLFVTTENDRILTNRRSEFGYVTVTGDNGWEKSSSIKIFNNNIYLLGNNGRNVYRYRPGLNGYSPKTTLIENMSTPALDFGIDGGIYLVKSDGKIERFVSGKTTGGPKGLILNKIPGEYSLGNESNTKIISGQNLFYVYILSGDKLWIFTPDSRRFQDISSLTYVAQLELQTDGEIRDISLPRDGTVYITTALGVYEILFEFVDGRVLIR